MNDLISRQAAIDALDGKFNITGRENAETIRDYINGVDKKLRELPSAERRGRWVKVAEGWGSLWKCDQCGEMTVETVMGKPRANYCPNCGSRMDLEEDIE